MHRQEDESTANQLGRSDDQDSPSAAGEKDNRIDLMMKYSIAELLSSEYNGRFYFCKKCGTVFVDIDDALKHGEEEAHAEPDV
ncbi:MAG: hypothetical protein QXG05_08955 [Nitrososphaerota archaeon]